MRPGKCGAVAGVCASRIGVAPTVNSSQMCRHIVFTIEFFGADRAWIRLSVQMGGYIMSVEVRWVGVRIVTDFASVSVSLL